MNRIEKTMRKGFTLMELMVVLAIMSILLVAVMSMTTPASRIFRRTAVSDNVYSAADNITGYLQRSLEYADNIWILDSSEPEAANDSAIAKAAKDFKDCYYKNVIIGTGTNKYDYVKVKVHVLKLDNTTGKIQENIYTFSDSRQPTSSASGYKDVINPNYFKGDYADYNFRYVLGASSLEPVDNGSGGRKMSGTEIVYCLKAEKDGETVVNDIENQAITLVANRSAIAPNKVGGVYEFVGPCVATVANLPFTNISSRRTSNGAPAAGKPVYRLVVPDGSASSTDIFGQQDVTHIPVDCQIGYDRQDAVGVSSPSPMIKNSFSNLATGNDITFDNDIYFIFAYADELVKP